MLDVSRETIRPKDEAHWLAMRAEDLTSTEVSALFGFNPYMTKFELWHTKVGNYDGEFVEHERIVWGNRLERAIAKGAAEENNWRIAAFKDYGRLTGMRIGSSFDFRITSPKSEAGLLEVKNLDSMIFHDGWIMDNGQIEAPPHIELQVQHEMLVAGYERNTIAGLVGGNQLKLIRRSADDDIHGIILDRCAEFWESVDKGREPPPLFPPDSKFIAKLYGYARTGKQEDMSNDSKLLDWCFQYNTAAKDKKIAQTIQDEMKARILMHIGDAEKVIANNFTVSAGMIGPKHMEYEKKGYRNFRVSKRKEK